VSHGRRVLSMASGTLASRTSGLVRVLVLAWVLGFTPIADAFNLANTVPNMLFDLVLGGVASATFIPVFVERLTVDGEKKAWRSISSVVTLSVAVLAVATAVTWIGAPWIIRAFTIVHHGATSSAGTTLVQQQSLATAFLRWFAPQIFFYGLIGIATALLNVRHRFSAASWVPVANNVVAIAVLVWFHLVDPSPTLASLASSRHVLWLGLGTSLGVAVQFLFLTPSLLRSDLWRLSVRINFADPAVRAISRLGSWTLAVVVANQVSLYVVIAYAFGLGGAGPVSAYTYGWSFMQMPYAVVVVSVLGALTPLLARLATEKNLDELGATLRRGLRQSLVIIVPATLVLMILAQPLVGILFNHVNARHHLLAGTVLAVLAAGLPGFTLFQLCVRGLQAMQRARDVFLLYAAENLLTIVLCISLGRHSMSGVSASVSISYTVAAAGAVALLAHRGVTIAKELTSRYVWRTVTASLAAALAIAVGYAAVSGTAGVALVLHTLLALLVGFVAYLVALALLATTKRRGGQKDVRVKRT
jgi:putative peptidoglycan lipid II flippase